MGSLLKKSFGKKYMVTKEMLNQYQHEIYRLLISLTMVLNDMDEILYLGHEEELQRNLENRVNEIKIYLTLICEEIKETNIL